MQWLEMNSTTPRLSKFTEVTGQHEQNWQDLGPLWFQTWIVLPPPAAVVGLQTLQGLVLFPPVSWICTKNELLSQIEDPREMYMYIFIWNENMTREKSINMAGHVCGSKEEVIVIKIFFVLWTQELLSLANFRSKFFSCCKGLYSIFGSTSWKRLKRMKFWNFNLALSVGPVLSSPGPCSEKRPDTVLNTNLNSNRNTETRPHHEAAELLKVSLTNLPSLGWVCLAPRAGSVDTITAAAKMLQSKGRTQKKKHVVCLNWVMQKDWTAGIVKKNNQIKRMCWRFGTFFPKSFMFWIMALLGNWEPTHSEKHCERDDIANEDDNEDEDEED